MSEKKVCGMTYGIIGNANSFFFFGLQCSVFNPIMVISLICNYRTRMGWFVRNRM